MSVRPVQEATLLILTALAGGSQCGYGIISDVHQISHGRVRLRAGTLYTALDHLRTDGLVEVDRDEIVAGRLRRYYRLIPAGADQRPEDARPDLRIGDAERDVAAAALGEHFAQGRLTLDELVERLEVALAAVTRSDISRATEDLPSLSDLPAVGPSSPVPDEDTGPSARHDPLI